MIGLGEAKMFVLICSIATSAAIDLLAILKKNVDRMIFHYIL